MAKEKGLSAENRKSIEDILASVTPVERSVKVCIRGDLGARLAEAEDALEAAVRWDAEHNEPPTAPGALEALDLVQEQAEAATVEFVCRALPSKAWRALIEAHPPGEDNPGWRWDPETFAPAAIAATVVEPAMTAADADELMGVLSDGQFEKLISTVIGVNVGDDLVPKSDLGIGLRQSFARSSTTAAPEESLAPSS